MKTSESLRRITNPGSHYNRHVGQFSNHRKASQYVSNSILLFQLHIYFYGNNSQICHSYHYFLRTTHKTELFISHMSCSLCESVSGRYINNTNVFSLSQQWRLYTAYNCCGPFISHITNLNCPLFVKIVSNVWSWCFHGRSNTLPRNMLFLLI